MKVEINKKRKIGKCMNTWKLNYTLLGYQWIMKKLKEKFKKDFETKMETLLMQQKQL